jgi:hypothetical protein
MEQRVEFSSEERGSGNSHDSEAATAEQRVVAQNATLTHGTKIGLGWITPSPDNPI